MIDTGVVRERVEKLTSSSHPFVVWEVHCEKTPLTAQCTPKCLFFLPTVSAVGTVDWKPLYCDNTASADVEGNPVVNEETTCVVRQAHLCGTELRKARWSSVLCFHWKQATDCLTKDLR
jgi:hypothetical protein